MKALIFNSGLGSRLGNLTKNNPKSMVRLGNGETIFHRQLRILSACGIHEFVVTTGPFADQLEAVAEEFRRQGCTFSFVANEIYDQTNYIFSMYRARDLLRGSDFVLIHGDLVFDAGYVRMVLDAEAESLGSVNRELSLPEKDFKARVVDGKIREVSVKIFGDDCFAFQPFYKLSARSMDIWLNAVERFVDAGDVKVYAENAANTVFDQMEVEEFSYQGHVVEEVDTPEDLERVSAAIVNADFVQQVILMVSDNGLEHADGRHLFGEDGLGALLEGLDMKAPLVVSGRHFDGYRIKAMLDDVDVPYWLFDGFGPNPSREDCEEGYRVFLEGGCDSLISVGGGSAIDVAKCIKALVATNGGSFGQEIPFCAMPHIAVPTTAGTGSESTHFAVCYVDGCKTSVVQECLLPDVVVLDPDNLVSLPGYQRKCTYLDALAQAIESYWSVRSSEVSRVYAAEAISRLALIDASYFEGDDSMLEEILVAANLAGKAINLTTTTVAHAMSYKLTSLYGVPHGHAVALCLPLAWKKLDMVGSADSRERLVCLSRLLANSDDALSGLKRFVRICQKMNLPTAWRPKDDSDVDLLVSSVNVQRLSNFPVTLNEADLGRMYEVILRGDSFDV